MAFLHAISPGSDNTPYPEASAMNDKSDEVMAMVLLSPDGNVLDAKGTDAEEFAAVAAYATQVARLVGESLGLEGFRELDCEFRKGRCLVYLDRNGNTVGVRPKPEVPMNRIREILGF